MKTGNDSKWGSLTKFGMADATDTNPRQPGASEGSLVVGKIRPPAALWAAIEGITQADPIRNGVLIIFAEQVRGRLGIFCNRYISGAINETTGATGRQAAAELLGVTEGMFGFRPCLGNESEELAQDLALDLDELLLLRGEKRDIGDALLALSKTGKGERIRDTKTMDPIDANGSGDNANLPPAPRIEKSSATDSFSYMDWFATDEAAQTDNLPKFRQILMNALPGSEKPRSEDASPENDLALYGRLLEAEQAKVARDIELSMQRARQQNGNGNGAGSEAAVSELNLMSEFIQAERARAQKWQGLDDIPTPRTVAGAPINPGNKPRTAEEYKDMNDLLSVSRHRITLPKDFIKRASIDEPPPHQLFDMEWLRRPYVIAGASIVVLVLIISAIGNMQARADFEDCLTHAKNSLKLRHPDDAVYVLNQAIQKDGSNPRAFFYRGLAYSAMGEFEKSANDFETSMKLGGPKVRTLTARASAACRAGKYDNAIADCTDVLKLDPKNFEALMIRATCYERIKDYGKVLRDTTEALKFVKKDDVDNRAHLLLQRGVAYTKEGKPKEAERDFGDAISLKPDAPTYMQRGDAYHSLKNNVKAAEDYSKVISLDPRNYQAYVARGIAYGADHKDKEALKDFARALSINKTGVEAMIQRGSLMLSNGHYRLAANDFEDAMELCPHDPETQQKLAMAYTHLHKSFPKSWLHNTELANSNKAAVARASTNASGSTAATSSNEPGTVSGGFKMPSDTKSLLNVGYQYLSNGQVAYATQMFAEAVRKEPNNVDARRYLAHALLQSGSASAAVSQFDALVDLDALTPRDALAYAKALTSAGKAGRAADVLSQCVVSRPGDVSLRAELMRLYNTMGRTDRTQACYQEGLRYARSASQRAELDAALRGRSGGGSVNQGDGSQLGG